MAKSIETLIYEDILQSITDEYAGDPYDINEDRLFSDIFHLSYKWKTMPEESKSEYKDIEEYIRLNINGKDYLPGGAKEEKEVEWDDVNDIYNDMLEAAVDSYYGDPADVNGDGLYDAVIDAITEWNKMSPEAKEEYDKDVEKYIRLNIDYMDYVPEESEEFEDEDEEFEESANKKSSKKNLKEWRADDADTALDWIDSELDDIEGCTAAIHQMIENAETAYSYDCSVDIPVMTQDIREKLEKIERTVQYIRDNCIDHK